MGLLITFLSLHFNLSLQILHIKISHVRQRKVSVILMCKLSRICDRTFSISFGIVIAPVEGSLGVHRALGWYNSSWNRRVFLYFFIQLKLTNHGLTLLNLMLFLLGYPTYRKLNQLVQLIFYPTIVQNLFSVELKLFFSTENTISGSSSYLPSFRQFYEQRKSQL